MCYNSNDSIEVASQQTAPVPYVHRCVSGITSTSGLWNVAVLVQSQPYNRIRRISSGSSTSSNHPMDCSGSLQNLFLWKAGRKHCGMNCLFIMTPSSPRNYFEREPFSIVELAKFNRDFNVTDRLRPWQQIRYPHSQLCSHQQHLAFQTSTISLIVQGVLLGSIFNSDQRQLQMIAIHQVLLPLQPHTIRREYAPQATSWHVRV